MLCYVFKVTLSRQVLHDRVALNQAIENGILILTRLCLNGRKKDILRMKQHQKKRFSSDFWKVRTFICSPQEHAGAAVHVSDLIISVHRVQRSNAIQATCDLCA